MALIRRIPRTSQPQIPAGASPLWAPAGLWNFAFDRDAVSGKPSTRIAANVANAITDKGRGVAVSGTGVFDRYVLDGTPNASNFGAGDFTLAVTFRLDATAGYSALSRWNSGGAPGTNSFLLGAASSFGTAVVDFYVEIGSTITQLSLSGSWTAGQVYSLFGRRIDGTLYLDRYDHAANIWLSNTTSISGAINDIAARKFKFGEIDAASSLNTNLTPFVAATFSRGLLNQQLREFAQNPWQLFAPIQRTIWVPVAAGGGTTFTLSPGGTVSFTGSSLEIKTKIYAPSGAFALSGTDSFLKEHVYLPSGTVSFNGVAPLSTANTFTLSVGGMVVFSGNTDYQKTKALSSSGTITFTGTTAPLHVRTFAPSGAISFSGTSVETKIKVLSSTGEVLFLGSAPMVNPNAPVGQGTWRTLTGMGQ
jgi:hypothetical protein